MTRLFIVDTNVVAAALLTRDASSPTARILDAMLDGRLMFLLSPDLLAEYRAVLLRPRLAARHGLSETEIDEILTALAANSIWREPTAVLAEPDAARPAPPDGNHMHLWELLACETTAVLVTGDKALLRCPYPGRELLQPGDMTGLK